MAEAALTLELAWHLHSQTVGALMEVEPCASLQLLPSEEQP